MMKISVLLLGLFLCAEVRAQVPATNLLVKDGQKVAFLGDSITDGGWKVSGGYVRLVVAGLDALGVKITPIPAGVGGNRSADMLARLDKDVISQKPDWMLLSCGVNDVWSRQVDLDTFKKNITAIVDKAQAAGIKVMLLTPTPIGEASKNIFNDALPAYVAFMVQLGKDRKLPVANENAAYLTYLQAHPEPGNRTIVTIDTIHPNADGHQIMAKTVLAAFGATPDQMAVVEKAWLAAPEDASVHADVRAQTDVPMSLGEYAALKRVAAAQKVSLPRLVLTAYLESIREVLVTQGDLSTTVPDNVSNKSQAVLKAKLAALAAADPGAAASPTNAPPASH
jgi:lysophospholipase L1-like esterase